MVMKGETALCHIKAECGDGKILTTASFTGAQLRRTIMHKKAQSRSMCMFEGIEAVELQLGGSRSDVCNSMSFNPHLCI